MLLKRLAFSFHLENDFSLLCAGILSCREQVVMFSSSVPATVTRSCYFILRNTIANTRFVTHVTFSRLDIKETPTLVSWSLSSPDQFFYQPVSLCLTGMGCWTWSSRVVIVCLCEQSCRKADESFVIACWHWHSRQIRPVYHVSCWCWRITTVPHSWVAHGIRKWKKHKSKVEWIQGSRWTLEILEYYRFVCGKSTEVGLLFCDFPIGHPPLR